MLRSLTRTFTTSGSARPKTAVVMLNMGGPLDKAEVEPFLTRLFADREIIQLPFQKILGRFIVRRRLHDVQERYQSIGGGSPTLGYTKLQGDALCKRLDEISPETAPHKAYPMFRYATPLTDTAIDAMVADGVTRAVAFSQYPQWSCTTSGASLNELWRRLRARKLEDKFQWSIIDRWATDPSFIMAVVERIKEQASRFDKDTVLVFSAHSLPMDVVNRGDPYPQLIGASVTAVVDELRRAGINQPYVLSYQSQVGPKAWLGPRTDKLIENMGKRGQKSVCVVPIAFTSDHVETLSEIDDDFAKIAKESGIERFLRAIAPNDMPTFSHGMANLVAAHLKAGRNFSPDYPVRCHGCTNPQCRSIVNPAFSNL